MKLRESENLTKFLVELNSAKQLSKKGSNDLSGVELLTGLSQVILLNDNTVSAAEQILSLKVMLDKLVEKNKSKVLTNLQKSSSLAALLAEADKAIANANSSQPVAVASTNPFDTVNSADNTSGTVSNPTASTNPFDPVNLVEISTNPFDTVNSADNTSGTLTKPTASTNPFDTESLVETHSTLSDDTTDETSTSPFDDLLQSPFHKKEIFEDVMQLVAIIESVKSELGKHKDGNDVILAIANGLVELAQESVNPITRMHSELTHLSHLQSKQSKILANLNDQDNTDYLSAKMQFENSQEMLSHITEENQTEIAENLSQLSQISQSITLQSIHAQKEIAEKDFAKKDASLQKVDSALKTLSKAYADFVSKHSEEEIKSLTVDFEKNRNEKRAEIKTQTEILSHTFKALDKSGTLAAQRFSQRLKSINDTKKALKDLRDFSESTQEQLNEKHNATSDNISAFLDSTVEKNKQTLYEAHLSVKQPIHKLLHFIYNVEVNFGIKIKEEYKKAVEGNDVTALAMLQLQIIATIEDLKVQHDAIKNQIAADLSALNELAQTKEYKEFAEQKIRELNEKLKLLPKKFSDIEMVLQHNAEKVMDQVDRDQLKTAFKPSEPGKFAIALQKFKDFIKSLFTRKSKVDDSKSAEHLKSNGVFAANTPVSTSVPKTEQLDLEAFKASAPAC